MSKALSIALITLLVHLSQQSNPTNCPTDPSIISPCKCTGYSSWGDIGPHLHCGGNQPLDLGKITKHLAQYYSEVGADMIFDTLNLNNSAITEIKENDLNNFRFGTVNIHNCAGLTKVDKKAFGGASFTGRFYWANNPKVSSNQVFELADSFSSASEYTLTVEEVPANAIHRRDSSTYSDGIAFFFYGSQLKTVQPHAFRNITVEHHSFPMAQGVLVEFEETGITSLPDEAFVVNTDKLRILFTNNGQLSGKSFSKNTFKIGLNVETSVEFEPVVSYLDEEVFTTFFNDNERNTIFIRNSQVDCSDARNHWLSKFTSRVHQCDIQGCNPFKPCQA